MSAQNGVLWIDGMKSEWDDGALPLMSDAVLRAASIFDAMVAVRQPNGAMAIVALHRHIRRLFETLASIQMMPSQSPHELAADCLAAANEEARQTGADAVYVRPMVVGYNLTAKSKVGVSATVSAFAIASGNGSPVSLLTSAFRRPSNSSLPPAWKATANYSLTRLVRIQAEAAGYDDSLLLNTQGRVAETAGAAVLVELDGKVASPPALEDCLPSITVDIVGALAADAGIRLERRPVSLTDVYRATGFATAGTLGGIRHVCRVDHRPDLPEGMLIARLADMYDSATRGRDRSSLVELAERV